MMQYIDNNLGIIGLSIRSVQVNILAFDMISAEAVFALPRYFRRTCGCEVIVRADRGVRMASGLSLYPYFGTMVSKT